MLQKKIKNWKTPSWPSSWRAYLV